MSTTQTAIACATRPAPTRRSDPRICACSSSRRVELVRTGEDVLWLIPQQHL